jgi:signal transduction histidine kinase
LPPGGGRSRARVCGRFPRFSHETLRKPVANVTLRTKLLIVFAALAFVPLVAVSLIEYRSGVGTVEALLRERALERTSRVERHVARVLSTQESHLLELARSDALREYVQAARAPQEGAGVRDVPGAQDAGGAPSPASSAVPDALGRQFGAYFRDGRDYLQAVTCLDSSGRTLFIASPSDDGVGAAFQTNDFMKSRIRYDTRVWNAGGAGALRSPVGDEPYGAALRVTVPVVDSIASDASPAVALVAEIRLTDVLREADQAEAAGAPNVARGAGDAASQTPARALLIALDNASDKFVYHTNSALSHQVASTAAPSFAGVAARMKAGADGSDFYDAPDGERRLVVFRQVKGLNFSLAAAEDYAAAVAPVRRAALFAAALALVAGLVALALLLVTAGREKRDIETVARGASAIAAGNLEQRITVNASGETRELAKNFNLMSDRLRGLITQESESKQFQSFLRISAMVSHDLKNAIAGLSMLVSNMERQFHREEFRADAIESLREATEKLKRTVARLSEPARSLSGEYRIAARPTDLVPIFRRVIAVNAEPSRPLYDIEARLPETLVATVEPDRVENVFENLVINALEAMGAKGGRLSVEAGTLEGDLVFFSVSDTGTGMTEEFVKTRLYRPFATTKNKGIGLGLYTCREIVEAHGGRLEVESRPGAGTRFRVVLPSRLFISGERREWPVKATATTRSAMPGASE